MTNRREFITLLGGAAPRVGPGRYPRHFSVFR
jgi:hypothetical protein